MTNGQDNGQADIRARIDGVDETLLVALWNSFCKATGGDDIIHLEDEFNIMYLGKTPLEVARMVLRARRFDLPFRWFMVDKEDRITTLHDRDDVEEEIDMDALAEWAEELDNNKEERQ